MSKNLSKILTKQFLIEEYVTKNNSIRHIASLLHCRDSTIRQYLNKYHIPIKKTGPIIINLVGQYFNKLKVIEYLFSDKRRGPIWKCECTCDNKTIKNVDGHSLKRGNVKSCGCLNRENIKKRIGKNHPNFKGYEEIGGQYWHGLKNNAKTRNLEFNISLQEAWELFLKQDRKCALTGQILIFASRCNNNEQTASLDRINSNQPYSKENCQWVHKQINLAKWSLSNQDFIQMCKIVSQYNHD